MGLLGKWNWWAPTPLRWLHRQIGFSERRSYGKPERRGVCLAGSTNLCRAMKAGRLQHVSSPFADGGQAALREDVGTGPITFGSGRMGSKDPAGIAGRVS